MRRVVVLVLAGCLGLGLVACGKKGPPVAAGPPDQITYPKVYPTH